MFEVQVVRQWGSTGARRPLQALRRRFALTMDDRHLKLYVGSPSSTSSAVLTISSKRIKSVRVRGRLVRVVVDPGDALTVRFQDPNEALRAAESMMDTWGVDPLVEQSERSSSPSEEPNVGMAFLAQHYVNDPKFRHLVHAIHDHIDATVAKLEQCYEASV
ncbi:hypothetical protein PsorP6_009345 [Peronosclerospora sorghi]|uniref:Uncharacterized protein n=1 Tax=Peronosclerospora sorghi TaxID=230839 RepID=A0ACC0W1A4_9STRA|nr:hypothetical protein PsorP6_009345 [Peronosclerospora sorghi]